MNDPVKSGKAFLCVTFAIYGELPMLLLLLLLCW